MLRQAVRHVVTGCVGSGSLFGGQGKNRYQSGERFSPKNSFASSRSWPMAEKASSFSQISRSLSSVFPRRT
jgi:hypothetical protein